MKKAFTLIELVFVVAIVGILAVVLAPNFQRDTLQEAANQIVSDIRYTQHLAMMDNKFANNDQAWYKGRWQIQFGQSASTDNEYAYSIYSDSGTYSGNPGISELAKNPINTSKLMSGGYSGVLNWDDSRATKKLNIGKSFGIKDIDFNGGCAVGTSTRIAFDMLGRPIIGNLSTSDNPYETGSVSGSPMHAQCTIDLCTENPCGTGVIQIAIEPETGYTYIL